MQGTNVPKQPTIPAKLTPYDADQKSYQRGLDDAWDAARKIALPYEDGGYSFDELDECFGETRGTVSTIFKNTPVTEVIKKIREYEKRKAHDEIKVGDEVVFDFFGREMKAIALECDEGMRKILTSDGEVFTAKKETRLKKTGRHIKLRELFGGEDA